jgi:tetratricopeptide (TPR) repeat protein
MSTTKLIPLIFLLLAGFARAGIFDEPKNLEVLPEDISAQQLSATMRGFSRGLGLRCSSCHVGEEGQDLAEYDFESDEKELKQKAREMLKMVNAINEQFLDKIEEDHVQVQCVTCHRGVKEPKLLGQVLVEASDEEGSGAIREAYFSLKERYYGSHSYDFSESGLGAIVRSVAEQQRTADVTALLDLMLEEYPQSFQAHFMYAELEREAGNIESAVDYLQKALAINPEAVFVQRRLEQLQQSLTEQASQ